MTTTNLPTTNAKSNLFNPWKDEGNEDYLSYAKTIRRMINRALCNPQLKIEVKRGFGEMFG
jgi:hypothetical protein